MITVVQLSTIQNSATINTFQALSQHSEHLAVTQLRWLGIHPTDVAKFAIPTTPFTNRDLSKVQDLVSRPYIQQNEQLLEQVKYDSYNNVGI